jgi:hypothetical protein
MGDVDLKNALLAGDPDRGDETEQVKTYAGVVTVRALSRAEVLGLQDARRRQKLTFAQFEAHMVALGLVNPTMTPGEVERWQTVEKAGGDLEEVTKTISRISGLEQGADKSRVSGAEQ